MKKNIFLTSHRLLLFLSIVYIGAAVFSFIIFGPIETEIFGRKVSFTSLVNPIRIFFLLYFLSLIFKALGTYNDGSTLTGLLKRLWVVIITGGIKAIHINPGSPTSRNRPFFDNFLIVSFVIYLFLPLVFIDDRSESMIERRKLVPFPEWKWNKSTIITFPVKFQAFFADHFGFRDDFAKWYYLLSIMMGNPPNSKITVGRDGWFFWGEDLSTLEDYRKNDPLTPVQLWQWKSILEANFQYLKQKRIHYLVVIPPEKHSIYGEYYPSCVTRIGRQSRLDQFLDYMKNSEVPILDLRQKFIQAKSEGQLFSKTDTHWNSFGAAIAQYEIMQYIAKLYPDISPIQYQAQDFSWSSEKGGDMAQMLNLQDFLKEQNSPKLRNPITGCERQELKASPERKWDVPFLTICNSSAPSALIFRDSMFTLLQPYISQYFSKVLYINPGWQLDFDTMERYVEQYSPNIVIQERVERGLKTVPLFQFQMGIMVYQLPDQHQGALTPLHQITIAPAKDGYSLISTGDDPYFELPKLRTNATKLYGIRVALYAPQKTILQIFYRTSQMRHYDKEHSFSEELQPGKNITYSPLLDGQDLQGPIQIRISPGKISGKYWLRSLEIRAIPKLKPE
jgi:alginate O-acetyltransferase complex protein AlgJ